MPCAQRGDSHPSEKLLRPAEEPLMAAEPGAEERADGVERRDSTCSSKG